MFACRRERPADADSEDEEREKKRDVFEDDIEAIVPEDKPEIAPEAEDEPDGAAADWHLDGPYVGAWTNRLVEGASHRRCVGRVEGYLPPEEADFLDKDGKPCALWRIRYVTGELEDELEDVEWHERARGVPRRCLHFNTNRLQERMSWVVSFSSLRPFGLRAGCSRVRRGGSGLELLGVCLPSTGPTKSV